LRPSSPQFLASLRVAHLIATRCDLRFPDGSTVTVPIEAGYVQGDRTAQVRRTGSVTIPWSLQTGQNLGLDLRTLPLGGYCYPYRGLRYPDGSLELLRLGTLRVESVAWKTSDQSAQLELADRMAQVKDEPFLSPYVPTATIAVSRAGTLTDDSAVITGLALTSDLLVGMSVTGIGVPAGRRIQAINSGSQITLNGPVNINAFKDGRVQVGNPVIGNITDTSDLTPGMTVAPVTTLDIAGGTTIAAIESPNSIRVSPAPVGSGDQALRFGVPANPQTLGFGGGVRVADAAIAIVQDVFGDSIAYVKVSDPAVVLIDAAFSEDRAEALQTLALAAGAEQYFGADGGYVFDLPAGAGAVVWTVDAGATGVMIGADEALNRTSVYNGVLVQGQNAATDPPVAALVTDSDPTSPTRWGGPFGKVARIVTLSSVQTVEQAQAAALTLLNRRLAVTRTLTVTQSPNPALEAGDVVLVRFPDGREEQHVIDTVRIGLTAPDPQTFVLRSVDTPATQGALELAPRRGVYYHDAAWQQVEEAVPA
jgi:Domain of unknown function (DUF5047)